MDDKQGLNVIMQYDMKPILTVDLYNETKWTKFSGDNIVVVSRIEWGGILGALICLNPVWLGWNSFGYASVLSLLAVSPHNIQFFWRTAIFKLYTLWH